MTDPDPSIPLEQLDPEHRCDACGGYVGREPTLEAFLNDHLRAVGGDIVVDGTPFDWNEHDVPERFCPVCSARIFGSILAEIESIRSDGNDHRKGEQRDDDD